MGVCPQPESSSTHCHNRYKALLLPSCTIWSSPMRSQASLRSPRAANLNWGVLRGTQSPLHWSDGGSPCCCWGKRVGEPYFQEVQKRKARPGCGKDLDDLKENRGLRKRRKELGSLCSPFLQPTLHATLRQSPPNKNMIICSPCT